MEEIKKINQYIGIDTDKFNEYYIYLISEYPSEREKKQIDDYIESSLHNFSMEIGKSVNEIGVKIHRMKTPDFRGLRNKSAMTSPLIQY